MTNTRSISMAAAVLCLAIAAARAPAADASNKSEEAAKLIALLKSPDAKLFERAKACQKLAVIGGKDAVAPLAALLADEKLAHYARFGLEPIEDPAVDEVLREAIGKLQGSLLVGAINSVGFRRDAGALSALQKHLKGGDPDAAAAAAAALGRIGTAEAFGALREALGSGSQSLRGSVAEAALACADGLLAKVKMIDAQASFDFLRKADVPPHVQAAALRGSILSRREGGVPLLLEALQGEPAHAEVALGVARNMPGEGVTPALAGFLGKLPAERKALVIAALGDRGEASAVPAIIEAAKSESGEARIAAIHVLKTIGDVSALPVLLEAAAGGDEATKAAALDALEELGGKDVDDALAKMLGRLDTAETRLRPILIELAGRRRLPSAGAALRAAADDSEEAVRLAAIRALGLTGAVEDLPILIARYVSPKAPAEGPVAEEALKAAVSRLTDKDASARLVLEAMVGAKPEAQARLYEILRTVGGSLALKAACADARSSDSLRHTLAVKALGEWSSEDAAPEILAIVKGSLNGEHRLDLLGRFKNVVSRLRFPKEQRLALCGEAMEAANSDAERKIVIQTYAAIPAVETLPLLYPHLQSPGLKEETSVAIVTIADRILRYNPGAMKEPLQKALAATTDEKLTARAKELLRQAGGTP